MKRGLVILLLSCLCISSYGKGNHTLFTFGTEWSYCATFLSGHRYYYIAPEGYRIEDRGITARYITDGEIYVHAGYNINSYWNVSVYVGYTGIGDYHDSIPISLRATRYFEDNPAGDRWFAFADLGSGISIRQSPSELLSAKAGCGYRLSLSRITKMDFITSLRFIHTHPDIYYYGEKVHSSAIRICSGYIMSACVGIGLTF